MSNLDPSGPSQPTLNTAYDQPANPSSTTEAEDRKGSSTAASQQRSAPVQETRQQNDVLPDGDKDQEYAQPTSLASGIPSTTSAAKKYDNPTALSDTGRASNTDGEQMRAAGDGDIASAQDTKHGFGEQGSLTAGLDRKKEEQDAERERRRAGRGGDDDADDGNDDGGNGSGHQGGVDLKKAMEGKETGFVPAGSNADANAHAHAGSQWQEGMGGGLGMQSGHGQV